MIHNKLTREDLSAGFYRNDQGQVRIFKAGGVDVVKLLKSVDLVEFPSRKIKFDGPPIGGSQCFQRLGKQWPIQADHVETNE